MAEPFRVETVHPDEHTLLLRVHGCLDASNAPSFVQQCHVARKNGRNLVLNLSGVSFIASSGIGALLALAEDMQENSGTLRLVALSTAVDSVIRLLNLDQFLTILATEQEALVERKAA
jgi:anti-sigma B factor antagonist